MARDYKKEDERSKEIYERINARIEKNLGIKLKEKLNKEGKSLAKWITENAEKYLKK